MSRTPHVFALALGLVLGLVFGLAAIASPFCCVAAAEPIDLGTRRELFVDRGLLERVEGRAELRLHHPTAREIALTFDQPWEGNASGYATVIQDGELYRMFYRGHRYLLDPPPLLGNLLAVDLKPAERHVLEAVERQRVGGQAVAAGAADLLVVSLDRRWHVCVRDEADVGSA